MIHFRGRHEECARLVLVWSFTSLVGSHTALNMQGGGLCSVWLVRGWLCLPAFGRKLRLRLQLYSKDEIVCALFPGPAFCIIVSAWTCMIMGFTGETMFNGPGSICVNSGFATFVVDCGTARVPMGLPM